VLAVASGDYCIAETKPQQPSHNQPFNPASQEDILDYIATIMMFRIGARNSVLTSQSKTSQNALHLYVFWTISPTIQLFLQTQ